MTYGPFYPHVKQDEGSISISWKAHVSRGIQAWVQVRYGLWTVSTIAQNRGAKNAAFMRGDFSGVGKLGRSRPGGPCRNIPRTWKALLKRLEKIVPDFEASRRLTYRALCGLARTGIVSA
jgi:hypothetical protein